MTFIRPTRRALLKLAAVAPAFALPAVARAQLGAPGAANPGYFHFTKGAAKFTVLSDGYFTQPVSGLGINAPEGEVAAFLKAHYLDTQSNVAHTNHLFIELGEARVLVDVGGGSRFFPTEGRLLANMEAAGIDAGTITHVFMTHAHPDHIWGIRDDFDEPIFPDAAYFLGEVEHGYWMQDGLVDRVAPEDQQFVVGAVNSINCDGVEWTLVQDGAEIAPGIRAMASFGHTAGHMSLAVDTGAGQVIALGDSMTHGWLNFAHPGWYNALDADPETTVATRARMLDMAASDGITMIGYHFPFPGVGHVIREAGTYRFIPALWQFKA
ncbi:MBL fold metallo-hydrolase [Aquicoccus sp. G2-2]|uniref:MBL fold metallo-hydrolase n=1 Tax=Aquicoccus sp. G2-2 TaxID=3092120 RepID=UPI002AE0980F|nr:MBL fold metallo-hydrolase [Aquicoccus sp. G2-2]MEA1112495.1 MBL fold metallo-hydrolase [Aquicoccus sp. G2-2]